MQMNMPVQMNIEIPLAEGEPHGATPNEALTVVRIQERSAAENRLRLGDRITHVNGIRLNNIDHFHQLMRYASPSVRLTILRPDAPIAPPQDDAIPEERKAYFIPQNDFSYKLVSVHIVRDETLGVSLRSLRNRVYVSRNPPDGSKAHGHLFVCDRIIDINGQPVSDQDIAAHFIRASIQASGSFNAVVERPCTDEKKGAISAELNAMLNPPSIRLAKDVREIAQEERTRLANERAQRIRNPNAPTSPPVQPPRAPNPDACVSFNETANRRHLIGSDNRGINLYPVAAARQL